MDSWIPKIRIGGTIFSPPKNVYRHIVFANIYIYTHIYIYTGSSSRSNELAPVGSGIHRWRFQDSTYDFGNGRLDWPGEKNSKMNPGMARSVPKSFFRKLRRQVFFSFMKKLTCINQPG